MAMRRDNELLITAKNTVKPQMVSINRISAWRERFRKEMGVYPEQQPAMEIKRALWRLFRMRRDAKKLVATEQHGNAHIVKMPKRRGQFAGSLPGGCAA